jgi:hypothetical protein
LVPLDLSPGEYTLRVDLSQPDGGGDFSARGAGQAFVDLVRISVGAGRPHDFVAPQVPVELEAAWGEGIRLLGFDPLPRDVSPGETVDLTLYWRALSAMPRSYTVFVHLLDGDRIIRGQVDSVPGRGTLPTTGWVPGEYLRDTYSFQVRPDAPAGPYRIEIGVYDAATGARLPVRVEGRTEPDDHVTLPGDVSVRPR